MEIKGPLIISVQTDDTSMKRELHISFKPAFIQQSVSERVRELQSYMAQITKGILPLDDGDPNRAGMEAIYQVCANLIEFIRSDEIDLTETIIIEIEPTINLANFIMDRSLIN